MKSHSTFTGRQIGRHVLASLSVIVALAASVSAQSVLGTTGNPLAGGTAAVAGGGSPAPNATAGNWKTYKHPVGLSLRYPGDWTVQEGPGFIHLISPEVQKSTQGPPTELYIVSAEQAGRISSLEDPRLIRALESSMTQMFPFLQRVGSMERIKAGNVSGIMLTREGTNPKGVKVRGSLPRYSRAFPCRSSQSVPRMSLRPASRPCAKSFPASTREPERGTRNWSVYGKVGYAVTECRIGRAATPSERTEP